MVVSGPRGRFEPPGGYACCLQRVPAMLGSCEWAVGLGSESGREAGGRLGEPRALVQPRLLQGGSREGRAALNLPLLFMSESDGSASKSGST